VLRTIWSTDGFPEDAGREEEAGADEEDVAWADDGDEAECEALLELEPEVWELPARTAEECQRQPPPLQPQGRFAEDAS